MANFTDLIIICSAGIFGGFIYSIQTGTLTLPHRTGKNSLNLGFLANCMFGLAGAIIIFLGVPGDFNFDPSNMTQFVKSLATALIGGWGGLVLIDSTFGQTVKRLEQRILAKEQQDATDAKAMEMASQYLTSSSDIKIPEKELTNTIKEASPQVQVAIMHNARDIRSRSWKNDKEKMERTIPIFEALVDSDKKEDTHTAYGQLAFSLKDQRFPDYKGAKQNFDAAIKLRDENNISGLVWYEFGRAVCLIHLDNKFQKNLESDIDVKEAVTNDLRVAFRDQHVLTQLRHSANSENGDKDVALIKNWLQRNNIDADVIGINLFE